MPNHVDNDLRINGTKSELKRFKEFAKGVDTDGGVELLSADKFIPYPKEFKDKDAKARELSKERETYKAKLIKQGMSEDDARTKAWKEMPPPPDGYNSGGYEWCIENWGTKWGFYDIELVEEHYWKAHDAKKDDEEVGELFYTFNTAWSPILPVIKKMIELFPELEFDLRYFEQGAGFNGMYRGNGGKVTADESGDYFGDRGG